MHLPAHTVARALQVLSARPLGVVEFHDQYWPDRRDRPYAAKARAARATLHPLMHANLVAKFSNGAPASDTFIATAPPGTAVALPVTAAVAPAVGPAVRPAVSPPAGPELDFWSGPGSQPVSGVEHDGAFGNVCLVAWRPSTPWDPWVRVPVCDELIDDLLLERVFTCGHDESEIVNDEERCVLCEAPLVRQLLAQTMEFLTDGRYQVPRDVVLRVTPEMAARVVWLRRARRAWSREASR